MAEGKLPNLARLTSRAAYSRLRTTFPALSPVAWSTFATGVNPGAAQHLRLPQPRPQIVSAGAVLFQCAGRRGSSGRSAATAFRSRGPAPSCEERASRSGRSWASTAIGCTILRVPITFPPEKFDGRLLSAMCTPDLKGTQGSFSHFTTRLEARADCTERQPVPARARGRGLRGRDRRARNCSWTEGGSAAHSVSRLARGRCGDCFGFEGRTLATQGANTRPGSGWRSGRPLGMKAHGIARFLLTETHARVLALCHADQHRPRKARRCRSATAPTTRSIWRS